MPRSSYSLLVCSVGSLNVGHMIFSCGVVPFNRPLVGETGEHGLKLNIGMDDLDSEAIVVESSKRLVQHLMEDLPLTQTTLVRDDMACSVLQVVHNSHKKGDLAHKHYIDAQFHFAV